LANSNMIRIERTYPTSAEEVWRLWTTSDGIESWWAPDGFKVEVRKLELRPGGELVYAMTAIGPELIDFVPGVDAYQELTVVDLTPRGDSVRVVMTMEPLHDEVWTQRLVMGRENELDNLAKLIDRKHARAKRQ